MKTTVRLIIVLVLCIIVFGGVFGMKYMGDKGMQAFFDNMPIPPATISTAVANEESWARVLEAVGTLTPVNGVEVTAESSGVVREIRFESGQQVEKGTVLVELDADTDRADLHTLETQAALAATDLKRLRKLIEQESISQSQFDQAESRYLEAQARVRAQRTRVNKKVIKAPFSGELGIRRINVGQYIEPGQPIVTLQALDPLYADFKLPEQQLGAVQPGSPVQVGVDLFPGEQFDGWVQAIEPLVDEQTRNFLVRAELPNPEHRLRPGVFARVDVVLDGDSKVLAVPRTAISYNPYGNSVFVIAEQESDPAAGQQGAKGESPAGPKLVARQRFVQTGIARGDYVAITSGLEAGEQVATSGLLKLRNGQPVIINNELAPKVSETPTPTDS